MQKTKTKASIVIVSMAIIATGLCMGLSVKADKSKISSKGNFIFKGGSEAAVYADDIYYLHSEIVKLFNEIK